MSRSINNVNYDEVDRHAVCQTTMSNLDPPLILRTYLRRKASRKKRLPIWNCSKTNKGQKVDGHMDASDLRSS